MAEELGYVREWVLELAAGSRFIGAIVLAFSLSLGGLVAYKCWLDLRFPYADSLGLALLAAGLMAAAVSSMVALAAAGLFFLSLAPTLSVLAAALPLIAWGQASPLHGLAAIALSGPILQAYAHIAARIAWGAGLPWHWMPWDREW